MEGHNDPFNRRTYPWGREDPALLTFFRLLGQLRKSQAPLRLGDIQFFHNEGQCIGFTRIWQNKTLRIYINRSSREWDVSGGNVLFGANLQETAPTWVRIAPMGFCITEA